MSLLKEEKKQLGAHCFICGYVEDDENDVGHGYGRFIVNKNRLSEWEKLIPKPGLKIGSAICGRHFDFDDIIKGREIGGVFYPLKKWSLKEHAVPKHLLCKPVAESPNCSQVKKGGHKIRNPFADCNKENRQAHSSKSSNNGKCITRLNVITLLHTSIQALLKIRYFVNVHLKTSNVF